MSSVTARQHFCPRLAVVAVSFISTRSFSFLCCVSSEIYSYIYTRILRFVNIRKARSEGFEPPTLGSEVHSSVQLSYERPKKWGERWDLNPRPLEPQSSALTGLSYAHHHTFIIFLPGAPGGSRTPSLRIRSPLLYPIELQAQVIS